MSIKFSNNGKTLIASAVSSSATTINVDDASVFPSISGSEYFYVTLEDTSENVEIVKVTGVSTNTLTVSRAQESTTARSFSDGDKAENRLTAGGLNDVSTQADTDTNTTYTAGSGLTLTGTQFSNSAPDQTVALTGAGTTTISGTYPNFTITGAASNTSIDTMTGDGTTTALTLSSAPATENQTAVYIDGVYQSKSNYSVSGTTLTFSTAPPNGSAVEVALVVTASIGAPSDGTVTSAKLSGDLTLPGDLSFTGNNKAIFGAGSDLQIYHSGSASVISDEGTGNLLFQTNGTAIKLNKGASENMLVANVDGSVDLYYDDAKKLATTSTGIDVTGTVTADGLTVDTSDQVIINHSADGGGIRIDSTNATNTGSLRFGDVADNYIGAVEYNHTNDSMSFYANNATRMTIGSSGNVAIGSSSATARLEVTGAFAYASGANSLATTVSKAATRIRGSSDASTSLFFGSLTNDAEQYIQSSNGAGSAADELVLNPYGGNVGIGRGASISPDADADNLVIQENGAAGITIGSSASSVGSIRFADSGSPRAGMIYYNHVGDMMRFYTNATERLRIDSAGGLTGTMFNATNGEYDGNLNDLKKTGFYRSKNSNSNNPSYAYYSVVVYGNQGNVTAQIATLLAGPATYVRSFNVSWTSWVRIDD